jgi:hypothetical protein
MIETPEEREVFSAMEQSSVRKEIIRTTAQPKQEQEPVAYINIEKRRLEWAYDYMSWDTPTVVNLPRIPLYTTLQQRKPLTDGQINAIWDSLIASPDYSREMIVRAIEAAHGIKEKNT